MYPEEIMSQMLIPFFLCTSDYEDIELSAGNLLIDNIIDYRQFLNLVHLSECAGNTNQHGFFVYFLYQNFVFTFSCFTSQCSPFVILYFF